MRTNVSFPSAGLEFARHLYSPGEKSDGPLPAIVVGHPASGVKEQAAAGLYAQKLAEQGLVPLAFNGAYQGESGGQAHGLEDPAHHVEEFKAADSCLTMRKEVDAQRIRLLGICASGGFVLPATGSRRARHGGAEHERRGSPRHFRQSGDGARDPAVFQGLPGRVDLGRGPPAPQRPRPGLAVVNRTTRRKHP